jgi:hypothetical protein
VPLGERLGLDTSMRLLACLGSMGDGMGPPMMVQ